MQELVKIQNLWVTITVFNLGVGNEIPNSHGDIVLLQAHTKLIIFHGIVGWSASGNR